MPAPRAYNKAKIGRRPLRERREIHMIRIDDRPVRIGELARVRLQIRLTPERICGTV